ncbi:MAG: hypothetical protein AAGE94_24350, partial [Acidobacteriota bacterium]
MSERAPLPGYLRFAWMFFMQPISLHRVLVTRDPSSRWVAESFSGAADAPRDGDLMRRELFLLLVLTSTLTAIVAAGLMAIGLVIHWPAVGLGWSAGLIGGLLFGRMGGWLVNAWGWAPAIAFSVVISPVLGVTAGVVFGQSGGLSRLVPLPFWIVVGGGVGVAIGWIVGLGGGIAVGVLRQETIGIGRIAGLSVALGLGVGIIGEIAGDITGGKAVGLAILASLPMVLTRLPLWPFEAAFQIALFVRDRLLGTSSLHASPILWHELSYLPLPLLGRHIVSTAAHDPALARRAPVACAMAPGQRDMGRRTLERLQATEL